MNTLMVSLSTQRTFFRFKYDEFTNTTFVFVCVYQTLQRPIQDCLSFFITCNFEGAESILTMYLSGFKTHMSGLTAAAGVRFPSTPF